MGIDTHARAGQLVRKVFALLLEHPEGLPIRAILDHVAANDDELSERPIERFEEVMRGCVAPIKAGWLLDGRQRISVSEAGKEAFELYQDPAEFIREAARRSTRGWLSVNFPKQYYMAGKLKDQLVAEVRAAKRIGLSGLMGKALGSTAPWEQLLPVQKSRRLTLENLNIDSVEGLLSYLATDQISHDEGGHAVYLPPAAFQASVFSKLSHGYPADAGLKIVKTQGGIDDRSYVGEATKGDSQIHLKLVHTHRHLTLVANLLKARGVGPRLYDLIEIEGKGKLWTAYVIQHVAGPVPTMAECKNGLSKLRALEAEGLVKVLLPEGFNDVEFDCPDCSRNAFTNGDGEFQYIDFQNFVLTGYDSYLRNVALEATEASHFGDESVLRGGRYLYQSVPGVNLPSKRSIDERMKVFRATLEAAGMSVEDRLVLDIGCNIGMMMGQYLKLGARWCHGWDRKHLVPHTERMLMALGCTRFSTTGTDISSSQPLSEDVPAFLKPYLDGCVVSYLAVRGHLGWLDELATLPWKFLIYEGHEGETRQDFEQYVKEFATATSFRIGHQTSYFDGDSDERTLAILVRD
ncbi:MAG TPA: hypothetical protein VN643_21050 [Pyrinomonadaceae bacterium]|nr:hypothetical protein [Pyrinomonadaceae bacterium]